MVSIIERPQDKNQLAKSIVDKLTTEETEEREIRLKEEQPSEKNSAAVALGRLAGLKGGKARAEKLPDRTFLVSSEGDCTKGDRITKRRAVGFSARQNIDTIRLPPVALHFQHSRSGPARFG
jgi:hypothetical protein